VAARERVAAAQAALQAAQALRSTDPSIGTSLNHYPGTSTRLLALRISVPLTGGQRFDGEIGRALAQEQQSQDLLQKTRVQARSELMALMQSWQASVGRLKIYDEEITAQAAQLAAQAELAYSKGGLTLTDLIEARRTLRSTQLEALTVRSEHAKALGTWHLRSASQATKP
jgi:cobalt-zinc-cadmium efflux system outer membrane protein